MKYCFKETIERFKDCMIFFCSLAFLLFVGLYAFDDGSLGDFIPQPLWLEKPLFVVLVGLLISAMYSGQYIREITTEE